MGMAAINRFVFRTRCFGVRKFTRPRDRDWLRSRQNYAKYLYGTV